MLWSYAKLPVAPPAVVMALVAKITDQLVAHSQRADMGPQTFDAQVTRAAARQLRWRVLGSVLSSQSWCH